MVVTVFILAQMSGGGNALDDDKALARIILAFLLEYKEAHRNETLEQCMYEKMTWIDSACEIFVLHESSEQMFATHYLFHVSLWENIMTSA